eukprot:m.108010 g.108010  ORF g.108010 m.108010 type:complete len:791 (-) comp22611_c0_seq1:108-2480(-)
MLVFALLLLQAVASVAPSGHCDASGCDLPFGREVRLAPPTRLPNDDEVSKGPQGPTKAAASPAGSLSIIIVDDDAVEHPEGQARFDRSLKVQGMQPIRVSNELDVMDQLEKQDSNAVVLIVTETSDVLMAADVSEILEKFIDFGASAVVGTTFICEQRCNAPTKETTYPTAKNMIGKASTLYRLYSRLHLVLADANTRAKHDVVLDTENTIFQTFAGMREDLSAEEFKLVFEHNGHPDTRLLNVNTGSYPCVLRGAGNNQLLNQVGNYLPLAFSPETGCQRCKESTIVFKDNARPLVSVGLTIEEDSPFLEQVIDKFGKLNYPQEQIDFTAGIISSPSSSRYESIVRNWAATQGFRSFSVEHYENLADLTSASLAHSAEISAPYHLQMSSLVALNNKETLNHLISQNREVISPLLSHDGKYFSTFWGAIEGEFDSQCLDRSPRCATWASSCDSDSHKHFMKENCMLTCKQCEPAGPVQQVDYVRSFDYLAIVKGEQRGVWDVPFMFGALLFKSSAAAKLATALGDTLEPSTSLRRVAFDILRSRLLRQLKVHLHVSNLEESFGLLINPQGYVHKKAHPDLYMVENNPTLWKADFIHPEYDTFTEYGFAQDGKCWDVYNFPLFSEKFCKEMIEEAEFCGEWSSGSNDDKRLKGGYEPVPTVDIHFNQMKFDTAWYWVLKYFVAPPAQHYFTGYTLRGRDTLDFIVKYTPKQQSALRPHHDASSVTINVALNRGGGVDYQGGGCHFIRQNCSMINNPPGYSILFPGRVTHQHSGLTTTAGTRYLLVSFIDQR